MTSDLKQYIHLIDIVMTEKPGERSSARFWQVTLEYRVPHNPPMLRATWYFDPQEYTEDALLPLARHYMHGLCRAIGESTADWEISKDQIAAWKRPSDAKSHN